MTPLAAPTAAVTALPDLAAMAPEPRQRISHALLRALDLVPREVDPDFAASVAAGYVETLDAWTARVLSATHTNGGNHA